MTEQRFFARGRLSFGPFRGNFRDKMRMETSWTCHHKLARPVSRVWLQIVSDRVVRHYRYAELLRFDLPSGAKH